MLLYIKSQLCLRRFKATTLLLFLTGTPQLQAMNSFLKYIVIHTTLRKNRGVELSTHEMAKGYRDMMIMLKRNTKDVLLIMAGIFSAAFGFEGFLLTNNFIDGGATGISLLLAEIAQAPLYKLIITINIPFVILGYKVMGKTFAFKTTIAITGLSLCLAFVHFPDITQDNLLVAVFGGFFLGAGIGLAMRGGAVIDGTEVLAIYMSRKTGASIGDIIIFINIIIFSAAAYLLGIDNALYSMITYMVASKTLDFLVEGIEEYVGVTIISDHSEALRMMIIQKLGRGVTLYHGRRGYGTHENAEVEIVFTVVTRLELNRLKTEITLIDETAFVVMHPVKDTKGGMIKKRPLH